LYFPASPSYSLPDEMSPNKDKSEWLLQKCETLMKLHLFGSGEINSYAQRAGELQEALAGPFPCREDACDKVYIQHSRRVK
jgi:hypothetical protein